MFLGLDLGTGSAKALVLDPDGRTVAETSAGYAAAAPQPGWSEIDPREWWRAVEACARGLPDGLRASLRGIGLSGQMHGVALADAEGQSLRPAILWTDRRAAECLDAYPAGAAERVGNPLTPGMAGPLLVWLARHEPGSLARARWALQAKDWLGLQLTGRAASEPSDASGTLLADRAGQWDDGLVAHLRLDRRLFAPVHGSCAVAGRLTPHAAAALGLPAELPVAAGAADTAAAALGSGLTEDGAAQLTTGSGAQLIVLRASTPAPAANLNCYRAAAVEGLPGWYVMAAMQNCGIALEWARGVLGLTWEAAYAGAFAASTDTDGAVFLPYLSGERTPWMDPGLAGTWAGLRPGSTPGAMMRAAFIGVACAIRAGLDALVDCTGPIRMLRLAGGGSLHPAWRQLLADVLRVPLAAVQCRNASARGAALLAGLATGHWRVRDLPSLAPAVEPAVTPGAHDCAAHYARFLGLRQRLSGWT